MSAEHLPECRVHDLVAEYGSLHPADEEYHCICANLRAYRDRLAAEYLVTVDEQQGIGFVRGLEAAIDTVDALPWKGALAMPEPGVPGALRVMAWDVSKDQVLTELQRVRDAARTFPR